MSSVENLSDEELATASTAEDSVHRRNSSSKMDFRVRICLGSTLLCWAGLGTDGFAIVPANGRVATFDVAARTTPHLKTCAVAHAIRLFPIPALFLNTDKAKMAEPRWVNRKTAMVHARRQTKLSQKKITFGNPLPYPPNKNRKTNTT